MPSLYSFHVNYYERSEFGDWWTVSNDRHGYRSYAHTKDECDDLAAAFLKPGSLPCFITVLSYDDFPMQAKVCASAKSIEGDEALAWRDAEGLQ